MFSYKQRSLSFNIIQIKGSGCCNFVYPCKNIPTFIITQSLDVFNYTQYATPYPAKRGD